MSTWNSTIAAILACYPCHWVSNFPEQGKHLVSHLMFGHHVRRLPDILQAALSSDQQPHHSSYMGTGDEAEVRQHAAASVGEPEQGTGQHAKHYNKGLLQLRTKGEKPMQA